MDQWGSRDGAPLPGAIGPDVPITPDRPLVVVPALNEEAALPYVIAALRSHCPGLDVLVVDDGSVDRTAEFAARAGASVAVMPFNVGVGGAMRAGFLYALRNGYDCVVQVDGDGQHDPASVGTLLAALAEADVVVGSRFSGGAGYPAVGPRRWAMRILAWSLSRICGSPLTDVTSGFRACGPRAVALFARYYPREYLGDTVESLVVAHQAGLRVREVGVLMRPRNGGRPSQSPLRATAYLARALLVLLLALVRSHPSVAPEREVTP
jgi:glycosyltransferase involved in cell wall biosynthesis